MAYENILYEVKDGIGTITFNRPKALNALNGALLAELQSVAQMVAVEVLEIRGSRAMRSMLRLGS